MTALMPIFIKKAFKDNPLFNESKIVYTVYDDAFEETMKAGFEKKVKLPGINAKDLKYYKQANYVSITKSAIDFSDGIVIGSEKIHPEIESYLKECGKPVLEYHDMDHYAEAYNSFYDTILNTK